MSSEDLASRPVALPEAHLITFACYGARLHGDPRGSIDRNHNAFRGRLVDGDERRLAAEQSLMRGQPYTLDAADRRVVLEAIIGVCRHEQWKLHAVHVRSSHGHVVVSADIAPESVLGKFKAYASRALNRSRGRLEKRWAHHGSTVYLWQAADVHDAVEYVYARQGAPMAKYVDALMWPQFLLDDDPSFR